MHYPVISHAYNQGLLAESDFVGTRDYSMFAAVPSAIAFHRTAGTGRTGGEDAFGCALRTALAHCRLWSGPQNSENPIGFPYDSEF